MGRHPHSANCPIKPPGPTGVPSRSCDPEEEEAAAAIKHSDPHGTGGQGAGKKVVFLQPPAGLAHAQAHQLAQASVQGLVAGAGGSMGGHRGGGGAAALVWAVVALASAAAVSMAQLQVGFYDTLCPAAEIIVQEEVSKAASGNPGVAPGLLRLHFHDCFVRGCDASVLLDSTAGNQAEKDAAPNASLRGFEVIDSAKTRLEQACFGVVSCADILAFAARDALALVGGNAYQVPAGRRDGNVSSAQEAGANLPPPTASVKQLNQVFGSKGLSQAEMVALSGAHTVGAARCSSFDGRLYSYGPNGGAGQDPSMDPAYVAALTQQCPQVQGRDPAVPMDPVTPNNFDTNYYANVVAKRGLLASDQALLADPTTAAQVVGYTNSPATFQTDFAAAMIKMGAVEVLTGTAGTIRTNCRVAS